ncbi:MAG: heparinase II/III family protein [Pseudomonadota bacterium]
MRGTKDLTLAALLLLLASCGAWKSAPSDPTGAKPSDLFAVSNPCAVSVPVGVNTLTACLPIFPIVTPNPTPVPSHPVLYFRASDLPVIRAKAAYSSANVFGVNLKSVAADVVRIADSYLLARPQHKVTLPYSHTVWQYTMSAVHPPGHAADPHYPPTTGLAGTIQSYMEILTFAYVLTGDARYLTNVSGTGAKDLVLLLAQWSSWTDPDYDWGNCKAPDGTGGGGLDTSYLTQAAAFLYDAAFSILTSAERDTIRTAIIEKGLKELDRCPASYPACPNGAAFLGAGLGIGALAVLPEYPNANIWIGHAVERLNIFVASQGTDGGYPEGFMYGSGSVYSFMRFMEGYKRAGLGNLYASWFAGIPQFEASFLTEDFARHPVFGDSNFASSGPKTLLPLAANGNADAVWLLQKQSAYLPTILRGPMEFNLFNPYWRPQPPVWNGSKDYRGAGYASLRNGWSSDPVGFFKAGPVTAFGHNQLDHNSFVIHGFGQWLATDPGYRSWNAAGSDGSETEFHNSILVDGRGQSIKTGGAIVGYTSNSQMDRVIGSAGDAYPSDLGLSLFYRVFAYDKVAKKFYTSDDLVSSIPHRFSYLLHGDVGDTLTLTGPVEAVLEKNGAKLTIQFPGMQKDLTLYSRSHANGRPYLEAVSSSTTELNLNAVLTPEVTPSRFVNPGFELGMSPWYPRGGGSGVGYAESIDDTTAHSGSKSGKIVVTDLTGGGGYFYSDLLSVKSLEKVTASVYYKTSGTAGTLLRFYYFSPNKQYLRWGPEQTFAGSAGWQQLSLEIPSVPTDVGYVKLGLNSQGVGTLWFDDAEFKHY